MYVLSNKNINTNNSNYFHIDDYPEWQEKLQRVWYLSNIDNA